MGWLKTALEMLTIHMSEYRSPRLLEYGRYLRLDSPNGEGQSWFAHDMGPRLRVCGSAGRIPDLPRWLVTTVADENNHDESGVGPGGALRVEGVQVARGSNPGLLMLGTGPQGLAGRQGHK